ncbi:MAG: 6-phosphofructokinase [Christensenellales bacterium]|jgi:phosphofructokinase-like protein
MRRIGILTGGGDAPGLNAVIRGVAEKCFEAGIEVYGLKAGWKGAIDGEGKLLTKEDVAGIQTKGGTILRSSRTNVMKIENGPEKVRATMEKLGLEGIVAIGGDDTLGVANKLTKMGMPMVGVPKTIDNDLSSTDYTFGFDTAANICMEALDRLHTTSQAHMRVMVVEIMGRHTGWIAFQAGLAADAHMTLIPEFPKSLDEICAVVNKRRKEGKEYTLIAVAEGFSLEGMSEDDLERDAFGNVNLTQKAIGETLARLIEERTGQEARHIVLGHLQRGGAPSAFDRVLGTRLGQKAGELVVEKKYGNMVALSATDIVVADLESAVSVRKEVTKELYDAAALYFG